MRIVSQITKIKKHTNENINNIVFMGMGEPFDNYENLKEALNIINDDSCGLKFSKRRTTVSTCGIIDNFEDFSLFKKASLAISLNATTNKIRDLLMPVNKIYPLEKLIDACKIYHLKNREKITFEYILIKDINDSVNDANNLVKLLKGIKAKVNLIPFNLHQKSNFIRPDQDQIEKFLKVLLDNNLTAIIRKSAGEDIGGACGQLFHSFKSFAMNV